MSGYQAGVRCPPHRHPPDHLLDPANGGPALSRQAVDLDMTPPPLLANWMASRAKTGGRVGRGGGTGLFPPPYPHGCVGQTRSEVTPPRRRRGLSLAGRWAPSPKAAARRPHSEITDARQSQDFRAGRAVPLPAATRHVLRPPRRHWLRGPVGAARAKSPGGRAQSNSQRGTPQGPLAGPVRKNGRNRRDRPRGGGGGEGACTRLIHDGNTAP